MLLGSCSGVIVMTSRRSLRIGAVLLAAIALGGSGCGGGTTGGPPAGTTSPASRSAPLWAAPRSAALPPATTAALQGAVADWVAQGHLKGATAAVVTPAGVWSGAAGVDGVGARLQPTSAMSVQSVSKTFTAAEVVLLASRGLVNLDAPLSDYLAVPFDTKGATVRQVLAMRSGFPDLSYAQYKTSIAADLQRNWTAAEILATLPADAARTGTAGGTPSYNGVNYILLAELIAKVSGKPLATAIRTDLLAPAGLLRTWVQTGEAPVAPLSVGTNPVGTTFVDPAGPFMPSRAFASITEGSGSVAADAADLARWGYLLYGGNVVDSAFVKQMEADPQEEPTKGLYALGTMESTDDTSTLIVGHAGGGPEWTYTTAMMVWTGTPPVAVVVLTPQPADFGADVADLVEQLHAAAIE